MSQHARQIYHKDAIQVWQDKCRIVSLNHGLKAMPYIDAAKAADYELGATLAAIQANRIIRSLLTRVK